MATQVTRVAAEKWEVVRAEKFRDAAAGEDTWQYEVVGRVVGDAGSYWVELPKWHATGYAWERQPRKYALPRGAIAAVVDGTAARDRELRELKS